MALGWDVLCARLAGLNGVVDAYVAFFCDSSDTDDALWMMIILLYQVVLLASA